MLELTSKDMCGHFKMRKSCIQSLIVTHFQHQPCFHCFSKLCCPTIDCMITALEAQPNILGSIHKLHDNFNQK